MSAKVASVTLTVEGPANPVVTIDGQTVPVAALGLKRPVDPGSHKVSATAEGYNAGGHDLRGRRGRHGRCDAEDGEGSAGRRTGRRGRRRDGLARRSPAPTRAAARAR